jgi:HK97 family phage prohead protease
MPIEPGKDETQADWMSRCVPEMIGTGDDQRPQEQAVAICLDLWRESHPEDAYRSRGRRRRQAPPPDTDESKDDFMDRCTTALMSENDGMSQNDAEQMCEVAWDEKGQPRPAIVKSTVAPVHDMEFTLSDETVDRYGDIVSADGWELDAFRKNPIALFGHQYDFPIGRWLDIHVDEAAKALRGKLALAPKKASARIDEIRTLIEAGILKAVSVGFRALERPKWIKDEEGEETGGLKFSRHELLECSVVPVPANPNALAIAKALNISSDTLKLAFAESGDQRQPVRRRDFTGEPAPIPQATRHNAMSLSQRIEDAQARETALRDRLTEHLRNIDDATASEAEDAITLELNRQIGQAARHRATLEEAEKALTPGNGAEPPLDGEIEPAEPTGRALMIRGRVAALKPVAIRGLSGATVSYRSPRGASLKRRKELDPVDYLVRNGVISLFAHRLKKSADEVRVQLYGDDEMTKAAWMYIQKAATVPADTTTPGWAAELVTQIQGDFMTPLMPHAIFPQLSARGLSLDFGRAGRIAIPTRDAASSVAGSFIGEGQPIPVRQGLFRAQIITPKKLGVITVMTREIEDHSIPAIEALLRDAISEDTGVSIDQVLLGGNAATENSPPGIRNGAVEVTATPGATPGFVEMVKDIRGLRAALMRLTNGNVRSPCWIMNPIRSDGIALTPAPGTGLFPFRDEIRAGALEGWPLFESTILPEAQMMCVDAADFVTAGQGAPIFEVSDQATLHMNDVPAQIVGPPGPTTAASPTRSLWQTDSYALRLLYRLNWLMRRPIVAFMSPVNW